MIAIPVVLLVLAIIGFTLQFLCSAICHGLSCQLWFVPMASIHAAATLLNPAKQMLTNAKMSSLFFPGMASCVTDYAAYMSESLQIFEAILVLLRFVTHNSRMPFHVGALACCRQSLDLTDRLTRFLIHQALLSIMQRQHCRKRHTLHTE